MTGDPPKRGHTCRVIDPVFHLDLPPRCTCRPSRDQLELFDGEPFFVEQPGHRLHGQPRVTGGDRIGFSHDATPDVFLGRQGDGPLIVCPDTNVLIWIVNQIERIEEKIGLLNAPLLGGNWREPVEAIADLLQLWQFRDIRFFVSDHYLTDGRLTPERLKVRERVVDELSLDFTMRGAFDTEIDDLGDQSDEATVLTRSCPVHPAPQRIYQPAPARWPHAKDRALLAHALDSGCHVFITCDKGVVACASEFARCGLAIMKPGELLERLDRDGQLEAVPDCPVDLDSVARFYGIAVAVDEAV